LREDKRFTRKNFYLFEAYLGVVDLFFACCCCEYLSLRNTLLEYRSFTQKYLFDFSDVFAAFLSSIEKKEKFLALKE